jgi:NADH-quinone oxidoreductase subunit B
MALADYLSPTNVVVVKSDELFAWARKSSLWYLLFGTACCAIEMMTAGSARYDFDRFGIFHRGSPRQADMIFVAGSINRKMAPVIRRLYDQMAEPKWVIAMGACACSGGPHREYPNVVMGVDKIIPVDVYVPGCPPRPEALMYAVTELQRKIQGKVDPDELAPSDAEPWAGGPAGDQGFPVD